MTSVERRYGAFLRGLRERLALSAPFEEESNWALLRRFTIGPLHDLYLDRLRIAETPRWAVWLHRIYRPDGTRHLHDHPRSFVSIVLLGNYTERTPSGYRVVRWFNVKRAEEAHSIVALSRRPVWTLVLCGKRRRDWGFHTEAGWVPRRKYGGEA